MCDISNRKIITPSYDDNRINIAKANKILLKILYYKIHYYKRIQKELYNELKTHHPVCLLSINV